MHKITLALLISLSLTMNFAIAQTTPESPKKVIADLGFTTPTKGIIFAENKNKKAKQAVIDEHKKMAKKITLHYGPMRTDLFVAETNGKTFRFTTKHKEYFIDVNKLRKRTIMIVFDGGSEPIIYYNPKKYHEVAELIVDPILNN